MIKELGMIALCVAAAITIAELYPFSGKAQTGQKIPIPAVAKFCGNYQVHGTQKVNAFIAMQAEGCENITFVHVHDNMYLGYGVQVVIGEANNER